MAGDPGFFGNLFGAARGLIGGAVRGFVGAPPPRPPPQRGFFAPPRNGGRRVVKVPGVRGAIERGLPGGRTGFMVDDGMMPRRRRMNVGNAKALRRAIRRTDGFVRLARSALKNTGFKIVSKSSGRVSRATMDKAVAAAHHAK